MIDFFAPIRLIRAKYFPILAIYFANGFIVFSQIAETFWIKNSLSLTASEVVSITIWANLPWSIKIVFGQLIGSIRICGSARYAYIWIAAFMMLIGNALTITIANQVPEILAISSPYNLLIIAGVLINLGVVLQDLIADILCYEIVDKTDKNGKTRAEAEVRKEIGTVQILARITDISAAIIATTISSVIATQFSYASITWFTPIVPLMSVLGIMFVRSEPKTTRDPVQLPILLGGIIYITFIAFVILSGFQYAQEAIFCVGMTIITASLYMICRDLSAQKRKEIFCILLVIFSYRIVPTYGPGIEWWQIDVLKFTPAFFAILYQIGVILGFVGVWVFAKRILSIEVGFVLFWLNIIHVVLQLPMIAMSFGLHEWTMKHFGFGAKTITLIDVTTEGPFYKLGFLVLCTVATYYAPKKHVVSWFALVMSLMSVSYIQGGRILKKILSNIFVIERGVYGNVPDLMIATTLINLLIPTIVILLFMNPFAKKRKI